MRAAAFLFLAAALFAAPVSAQSVDLAGRWASSQGQCDLEFIAFERDGSFRSQLEEEPREGTWKLARDRVTLIANDEPDRPWMLHILDYTANRLVVLDEAIESDRRLQRCR
ncbi:hypothetical protein [Ferrovibrio sp.]|uniref:hypothetical protein n=1 Tax=Ferrovibrio sp. TaxID=1917215 RepID=UPI003D1376B9